MKKILILMIAVMAMCVQSVSAQQSPNVMLHHNGKATLFGPFGDTDAINAAVDGDTIYIPARSQYGGDITINKKITIMGQGETSKIGSITIELPGGSEMTSTILYGLYVEGTVNIKSSVTNLHIDKCNIYNLYVQPNSKTSTQTFVMKNMLVERCRIRQAARFYVYDEYENCIVRNCWLQNFQSGSQNISCINDRLYMSATGSDYGKGNYINCIISGANMKSDALFINCQTSWGGGSGTYTDCYVDSKTDYTDEELQFKGYLGTDGTIVGPNGGARPYNLVPAVPSLEDIKLDVNYTTRKLNVTVKVKAN